MLEEKEEGCCPLFPGVVKMKYERTKNVGNVWKNTVAVVTVRVRVLTAVGAKTERKGTPRRIFSGEFIPSTLMYFGYPQV